MAKRIVICSDGTGQKYGPKKSNVARLFKVLDLSDRQRQIGCYDPGVGTISDMSELRKEVSGQEGFIDIPPPPNPPSQLDIWRGQLFGDGLVENVNEMYSVLVENYIDGDQIFMFGFSRGAFAVRVLAGLLHRCGLLLPEHRRRFWEAFKLYEPHNESYANVSEFKRHYARPDSDKIEVEFLGLWDTVKSYGYVSPKSLPHTRYNPIVKNVRHALAVDEKRSFYIPTTWGGLDPPYDKSTKPQHPALTVREIWFAGDHSDVGGGHDDVEGCSAARFSLEWMIQEACDKGLLIDQGKVLDEFEAMLPKGKKAKTHNLLRRQWYKWGWLEFVPRIEFDNSHYEPKPQIKWLFTGFRQPGQYKRNEEFFVHRSAVDMFGSQRIEELEKLGGSVVDS